MPQTYYVVTTYVRGHHLHGGASVKRGPFDRAEAKRLAQEARDHPGVRSARVVKAARA